MNQQTPPSPRVRVRRHSERGRYEPEIIDSILEEALICHVGVVVDGQPVVLPTIFGRIGDTLYLHGAVANRSLRAATEGLCVTVTLIDGLVLARSTPMHSINYRSVVMMGRGRPVTDLEERSQALRAIVEHAVPGRSEEVRGPSPTELATITVIALDLGECSAKVRTGPPIDPEEDRSLPVWAGVVPVRQVAGTPSPDAPLPDGIVEAPPSVAALRRRFPGFTPPVPFVSG